MGWFSGVVSLLLGNKASKAQARATTEAAAGSAAAQRYAADKQFESTEASNTLLKEQFDLQLKELRHQYDRGQSLLMPYAESGAHALSVLSQKILAGPNMNDPRMRDWAFIPDVQKRETPPGVMSQQGTPDSRFEGFGPQGRNRDTLGLPEREQAFEPGFIRTPGVTVDSTGKIFTEHPTTGVKSEITEDAYIDHNGYLAMKTEEHGWINGLAGRVMVRTDGQIEMLRPTNVDQAEWAQNLADSSNDPEVFWESWRRESSGLGAIDPTELEGLSEEEIQGVYQGTHGFGAGPDGKPISWVKNAPSTGQVSQLTLGSEQQVGGASKSLGQLQTTNSLVDTTQPAEQPITVPEVEQGFLQERNALRTVSRIPGFPGANEGQDVGTQGLSPSNVPFPNPNQQPNELTKSSGEPPPVTGNAVREDREVVPFNDIMDKPSIPLGVGNVSWLSSQGGGSTRTINGEEPRVAADSVKMATIDATEDPIKWIAHYTRNNKLDELFEESRGDQVRSSNTIRSLGGEEFTYRGIGDIGRSKITSDVLIEEGLGTGSSGITFKAWMPYGEEGFTPPENMRNRRDMYHEPAPPLQGFMRTDSQGHSIRVTDSEAQEIPQYIMDSYNEYVATATADGRTPGELKDFGPLRAYIDEYTFTHGDIPQELTSPEERKAQAGRWYYQSDNATAKDLLEASGKLEEYTSLLQSGGGDEAIALLQSSISSISGNPDSDFTPGANYSSGSSGLSLELQGVFSGSSKRVYDNIFMGRGLPPQEVFQVEKFFGEFMNEAGSPLEKTTRSLSEETLRNPIVSEFVNRESHGGKNREALEDELGGALQSAFMDSLKNGGSENASAFSDFAHRNPRFYNKTSTEKLFVAQGVGDGTLPPTESISDFAHNNNSKLTTDFTRQALFEETWDDVRLLSEAVRSTSGRARLETSGELQQAISDIDTYRKTYDNEMTNDVDADQQFRGLLGLDPWTSAPVSKDDIGGWLSSNIDTFLEESELDSLKDRMFETYSSIESGAKSQRLDDAVLQIIEPLSAVLERPAYDALFENLKEFGVSQTTRAETDFINTFTGDEGNGVVDPGLWSDKETGLRAQFESNYPNPTANDQNRFDQLLNTERNKHEAASRQFSINQYREEQGLPPESTGVGGVGTGATGNALATDPSQGRMDQFAYERSPGETIDERLGDYTPTTDLSSDPRMAEYQQLVDYDTDPRLQQREYMTDKGDPRIGNYDPITDIRADARVSQGFDLQNALNPSQDARLQDFDYEKSPGYQFRLDEAEKAMQRGAAAKTGALSGAAQKDLARYSQDYAYKDFDQERGAHDRRRQEAISQALQQAQEYDRRRLQALQENRYDEAEFYARRKEAVDDRLREETQESTLRDAAISERAKDEGRHYDQRGQALNEERADQAEYDSRRGQFFSEYYGQQANSDRRRREFLTEYYHQKEDSTKERQNALNEYYASLEPVQSLAQTGQQTSTRLGASGSQFANQLGDAGATYAQGAGRNTQAGADALGRGAIQAQDALNTGIIGAANARAQFYNNVGSTLGQLDQQQQNQGLINALNKKR
jgi:hypothetical protein